MRTTHHLVRPAHLNQFGFLFGGQLLAWVDEAAWIAASLSLPGCHFVTIGMNEVSFHHPVREGDILKIESKRSKIGHSSVTFSVVVYSNNVASGSPIFSTEVTFVNVDPSGSKKSIPDRAKQAPASL